MTSCFHVHKHQSHLAWDNSLTPIHTIKSGDTVSFDTTDASNGQITASSTVDDVRAFKMDLLDQVNGPIYVTSADPGDVLEVEFLDITCADWGWTAIIPGFGLLHEEFPDPALKVWRIDDTTKTAKFNDKITIDTSRPFTGEAGLARGLDGAFSTIPPYKTGGNLDTRHVPVGSKLYLPVEVPGALFSLGDGHAAQGDGEVCGTAIETPLKVTVRLTVRKDKSYLSSPHVWTKSIATSKKGYYIVSGIEDSMLEATKSAIRGMMAYLMAEHDLSKTDAYMLCSVAVELKVACCVDSKITS